MPKAEEGVEAEVVEAEVEEAEEEVLLKKIDSKELAEDSLPSGETGNLEEATEEEVDKSLTRAQM